MIRPETTFCNLPHVGLSELGQSGADVAIFGASHGTPYQPGTPSHAAGAPAALRAALEWYDTQRTHIDMDTGQLLLGAVNAVDVGDVQGDPTDDGARNRAAIRAAVEAATIRCRFRFSRALPVTASGWCRSMLTWIGATRSRG